MIILPDRNIPRAKFLMPMLDKEWREPSQFVPRDQLGNPSRRVSFRIRAKTHDGVVLWSGLFDDREDFDTFLYAIFIGTLPHEKALWNLPKPMWPGLEPGLLYDFVSTHTMTDAVGSSLTYNAPLDWNSYNNHVICVAGGGGGGGSAILTYSATGGGGGACSIKNNVSFTTATYQNGTGRVPSTCAAGAGATGVAGGDTWFNGIDFASSSCGAKGGQGGNYGAGSSSLNGGAGGAAASGIGDVKVSGGRGGNQTSQNGSNASGGGGAAGPGTNYAGADGNNGVDYSGGSNGIVTNGGSGDGGLGGSAGAGVKDLTKNATGGSGGDGTEIAEGIGSGGGGGGCMTDGLNFSSIGGPGGNYGGGGGGTANPTFSKTAKGGTSKQGMIALIYTPALIKGFNMPVLGM